ncbi:endonuclease/exonuclease/phosphatase family protein [Patescibacteria group bacterium]|nr:endonuclease/exonuclease/phosphatase family protein [Patescibacteria group bacterium]MBU1966807.1 endonuclease/exonuclease/phosphatase family protein [Patescibacteria group bacterium]MBU2543603.1 endonuclease/exonuclease/phosphatase family protein [Patescibacteria group bacterium]
MTIKVISLNLWGGGRLFDQAAQFLLHQQADIMLLQETYDGKSLKIEKRFRTVSLLTKLFPNHSYNFAPSYLDTRKKEGDIQNGQLIISKFPLNESQTIHPDVPYGAYDHDSLIDFSNFPALLQTAFIQVNSKKIKLLNIHGPVNFDGTADTKRRLKMRDIILQEIKNQPNTILGGDFNIQPQTQTIRDIEAKLTNVFKDELKTTFNLKQKNLTNYPGFADAVVDMMFISPNIKVLKKSCPPVNISDHLPLVAHLDV